MTEQQNQATLEEPKLAPYTFDEVFGSIAEERTQLWRMVSPYLPKSVGNAGKWVFEDDELEDLATYQSDDDVQNALMSALANLQKAGIYHEHNFVIREWGLELMAALSQHRGIIDQELDWQTMLMRICRRTRIEMLRLTLAELFSERIDNGEVSFVGYGKSIPESVQKEVDKTAGLPDLVFLKSTDLPEHNQWLMYHWLCIFATQFEMAELRQALVKVCNRYLSYDNPIAGVGEMWSLTGEPLEFSDSLALYDTYLKSEMMKGYGMANFMYDADEQGEYQPITDEERQRVLQEINLKFLKLCQKYKQLFDEQLVA
ncbi:hypothetical protein ACFBZI_11470 [Moraxella sp. ZJ142]|uniref:hypothetical protein n=1 Tax=Moraxella marmotae TaxID=3344520 RepID=UPI0035D4372E